MHWLQHIKYQWYWDYPGGGCWTFQVVSLAREITIVMVMSDRVMVLETVTGNSIKW